MTEKSRKVLSFPAQIPAKADYQRVKSNYSTREIKQMFGLSERTIRRWTEAGIVNASAPLSPEEGGYTYDFQALTLFRRGRGKRAEGLTIKKNGSERQGQLSPFRPAGGAAAPRLRPP